MLPKYADILHFGAGTRLISIVPLARVLKCSKDRAERLLAFLGVPTVRFHEGTPPYFNLATLERVLYCLTLPGESGWDGGPLSEEEQHVLHQRVSDRKFNEDFERVASAYRNAEKGEVLEIIRKYARTLREGQKREARRARGLKRKPPVI